MSLSEDATSEIEWWLNNIMTAQQMIYHIPPIDQTLCCDPSEAGWGAHDPDVCPPQTIQRRWTNDDEGKHINQLEMRQNLL